MQCVPVADKHASPQLLYSGSSALAPMSEPASDNQNRRCNFLTGVVVQLELPAVEPEFLSGKASPGMPCI